jgi:hypothetical protein
MKKITIEKEKLVCIQYKQGWAVRRIAEYVSISQTTVMSILKRHDVPLRGGRHHNDDKVNEVVSLYLKGDSIKDILEKTAVRSEQTVYRILREKEVKMRKNI